MKKTFELSDFACAEPLIIRLPVDEDTLEPYVGHKQIDEVCNWWTDPKGRGFLQLEDGYGVVIVDASSGEPRIEIWSDTDDERYELVYFPYSTLTYEMVPDDE